MTDETKYVESLRKKIDEQRQSWEHGVLVRAGLEREIAALRAENARPLAELGELRREVSELQAGARTGLLQFMIAGDVGHFVDQMRQILQALMSGVSAKGRKASDQRAASLRIADKLLNQFFEQSRQATVAGQAELATLREIVKELADKGIHDFSVDCHCLICGEYICDKLENHAADCIYRRAREVSRP